MDENQNDVVPPARLKVPTAAETRAARKEFIENHRLVKGNSGWVNRTLAALEFDGPDAVPESDHAELEAFALKRDDGNNRMTSAEISLMHRTAEKLGTL